MQDLKDRHKDRTLVKAMTKLTNVKSLRPSQRPSSD